jgi:hypothetical protein
MSEEAKIVIGLEGAEQVSKAFQDLISNAKKVGGELEKASKQTEGLGTSAKKAGEFWKDFGKSVGSSLSNVGTAVLSTVTAVQTLSFAQAIQSAKSLDDQMARFAAGSGRTIGGVKQQVRELSLATNTQEKDVLAWAKALGRVTYDSKGAFASYKALAAEAIASNQDLADQQGLGETLRNSLGVAGDDTQKFLDSMRGMSEVANNAGGFNAFKDQVVGLSGVMSTLSLKTDDSKKEFLALQLALGKGQTPQQAARSMQGVVSGVQSHAEGLARQFGRDNVYDENGRVKDIPAILSMVKKDLGGRFGGSAKRVAMNTFGPEFGAAINNFDEDVYRKSLNAGATGSGAADAYMGSDEAKRANTQLRRDQSMEDAGRMAFGVQDSLGEFGANHPILSKIGGLLGGSVGGGLLKAGGKAAWSSLFGGGGAAAAGGEAAAGGASLLTGGAGMGLAGGLGLGAAGVAASLGALTAATAPLNANMPQIRGETAEGLEGMREGRARAIVAAVERGGAGGIEGVENALGPATLGAVKQDPVLSSLLAQFEAQQDTISGLPDNIAKAVAQALKGSPLSVNVLNQTGGPVHGVSDVQNGSKRQ